MGSLEIPRRVGNGAHGRLLIGVLAGNAEAGG